MNNTTISEKLEAIETRLGNMEQTLSYFGLAKSWTSTSTGAVVTQTRETQPREWYTPKQFAEELGYAPKYVYNLIGKRAVSTQKVEGRRKVLIHRSELEKFIGNNYRPSAQAEIERAAVEAYNKLTKKRGSSPNCVGLVV